MKSCTCSRCVDACRRYPGWPTPDEAEKMLDAGYAKRMTLDYWSDYSKVYVLIPGMEGYHGAEAPYFVCEMNLTCTFFNNERCDIHDSGYKPLQCRAALCCSAKAVKGDTKRDFVELWDTDRGKALVERWRREVVA